MEQTLILFDIDGTLLDLRGAGRRSFVQALEKVFGWQDDIPYINFSGNTDLNVLQQVFDHHRRPLTVADQRRFFTQLPRELADTARHADLILYPGVRELLETLAADQRVVLGLVTGNIEACARIKLQQFELQNHFVLGAFGDDHADRAEIARLALQRITANLSPDNRITRRFLIGDTPFDVAAAKTIGATAVAVATGRFSTADLRDAGADHVLNDLGDRQGVLELLGLSLPQPPAASF